MLVGGELTVKEHRRRRGIAPRRLRLSSSVGLLDRVHDERALREALALVGGAADLVLRGPVGLLQLLLGARAALRVDAAREPRLLALRPHELEDEVLRALDPLDAEVAV